MDNTPNTYTIFGTFSILKENDKYSVHSYVPINKSVTEWGKLDTQKSPHIKCAIMGVKHPEYVIYIPAGLNVPADELKHACCKEEIVIYNEGIGGIGHLHPMLFDLEWKDGGSAAINI